MPPEETDNLNDPTPNQKDPTWTTTPRHQGQVQPAPYRSVPAGARGSVTVEIAVLFPAFLTLIFLGVQAAEWYHVRSLCLAAADAGVRAGRQAGASDARARDAAAGFLSRTGGGTAVDPTVSTAGSTTQVVRVEVAATVPRVLPLPGLTFRVAQSAQAGREVFSVDRGP